MSRTEVVSFPGPAGLRLSGRLEQPDALASVAGEADVRIGGQTFRVGIDNPARIFSAARHPKSFVSLAGADHLLSDHADADYCADVIGVWAQRNLT